MASTENVDLLSPQPPFQYQDITSFIDFESDILLQNKAAMIEPNEIIEEQLQEPEYIELNGKLERGETFRKSLIRNKMPSEIADQIIKGFKGVLNFRKLTPNDKYTVVMTETGQLVRCLYKAGPIDIYTLKRDEDGFEATKKDVQIDCRTVKLSGVVKSSLFTSFYEFEEAKKLIYSFADIFSAKIDFNTETRNGDSFCLVFEKYYKKEKFIGYGKILYARYEKKFGEVLEGFYYSLDDGHAGYFDRTGKELGASFIKSPVPVGRITSGFTTHRKHPILGIVRPHLGVDLAAPYGTPVMAAADGKVEFIGINHGFGKQVVIRHEDGFETYYGHLSKFKRGLKKGKKVHQKEVIGYIGSTGMATGPHLDYRIQHRGIFKNPFNIKFKPKSIIEGENLVSFQKHVQSSLKYYIDNGFEFQIIQVKQITVTPDSDIYFL